LVDHEVTVELKNNIQIRGTLKSVDQYLNIKLDDIQVVEELKYPHLVGEWRLAHWSRIQMQLLELLLTLQSLVIGQERFHQRQRSQVCASAWKRSRYGAVGRWYVLSGLTTRDRC